MRALPEGQRVVTTLRCKNEGAVKVGIVSCGTRP